MSRDRVYFDYNATAPLRPAARATMLEALDAVGNASSVHAEGRAAHTRLEAAREAVARLVGGAAKLVTFTSGGTEANNTVLTPNWNRGREAAPLEWLLVGATEHPSVLAGGRFAQNRIRTIPVDGEGIVNLDALKRMLGETGGPALVSVMLANNETGAIQPVREVAEIAHAAGAIVHTDAVQAAGRIPVDLGALGVDVLTLSAHKIGGPHGAGAIVRAREDLTFAPLLTGGGQERRTAGRNRERRGDRRIWGGRGRCPRAPRPGQPVGGLAGRTRRRPSRRRAEATVFSAGARAAAADALLGRSPASRPKRW